MFLEGSDIKLRERLVSRAQGVNAGFREELFLDLVRWDQYNAKDMLKRITIPALVLQSIFFDADLKRAADTSGNAIWAVIRTLELGLLYLSDPM
jgi:hypothetical protein